MILLAPLSAGRIGGTSADTWHAIGQADPAVLVALLGLCGAVIYLITMVVGLIRETRGIHLLVNDRLTKALEEVEELRYLLGIQGEAGWDALGMPPRPPLGDIITKLKEDKQRLDPKDMLGRARLLASAEDTTIPPAPPPTPG